MRVTPLPPIPLAIYYRFDGASRRQGRGGAGEAGWGAAVWDAGSGGSGAPVATCTGYLGEGVSNNVSEYSGLHACLARAVKTAREQRPTGPLVFEGDSDLILKQVRGQFACRAPSLWPTFESCRRYCRELEELGVAIHFRHIYREYNTVADALSNEAVDGGRRASGPRAGW